MVLEVVGDLVEATADEETPQLPNDLNTTNEIITETLGLLFRDLDTTTGQNETNVTVADVSSSDLLLLKTHFTICNRLQLFLKLWTTFCQRVTRQVLTVCRR